MGMKYQGGSLLEKFPFMLSRLAIDADKDWLDYGIHNVKELAENMQRGDMITHSGSILVKLTPGYLSDVLTSRGAGNSLIWKPIHPLLPIAGILPVAPIIADEAQLNGEIVSDRGAACDYRFRYRILGSGDPWTYTAWSGPRVTGETFSTNIIGLTFTETYEVQVQAMNIVGEGAWSSIITFYVPLPACEPLAATHITDTTARINGVLIEDSGSDCEVKFRWRIRPISWLGEWTYCTEISITEMSNGSYDDYPTIINVPYVVGKMENDFADIRFTEDDGQTLIPYGLVSKVDGVSASFVLRRNYTPLSGQSILMYHGNPGVISAAVAYGTWIDAWYNNNSHLGDSGDYTDTNCAIRPHTASGLIPAWAGDVFYVAYGDARVYAYYGRSSINGVGCAWASTVVCDGEATYTIDKYNRYDTVDQSYNHAAWNRGNINTVIYGHYSGPQSRIRFAWYPVEPDIVFGSEREIDPRVESLWDDNAGAYYRIGNNFFNDIVGLGPTIEYEFQCKARIVASIHEGEWSPSEYFMTL